MMPRLDPPGPIDRRRSASGPMAAMRRAFARAGHGIRPALVAAVDRSKFPDRYPGLRPWPDRSGRLPPPPDRQSSDADERRGGGVMPAPARRQCRQHGNEPAAWTEGRLHHRRPRANPARFRGHGAKTPVLQKPIKCEALIEAVKSALAARD